MPNLVHSTVARFNGTNGTEVVFSGGHQGRVFDVQGREYVDFVLGFGPVVIGHASPVFVQRLRETVGAAIHLPGYAASHYDYVRSYLGASSDWSVALFKHSSDSVTAAARLACLGTGRMGIVRCGYIGWHDAQIASTPRWHETLQSPLRRDMRYQAGFRGVGTNEPVYDWVDLDSASLQGHLEDRPGVYACFIIDAYQYHLAPPGSVERALEICRSHGIRIVFDETKTAGRVSPLGALTPSGLKADFLVLGKAIANGAPLSMLLGPADMQRAFVDARIGGTFCKELLSLYAAQCTLDLMLQSDGYPRLRSIGQAVVDTFNAGISDAGCTDLVQTATVFGGSMFELTFHPDILANDVARRRLRETLCDLGVLVLQGHPSFVCLEHESLDLEALRGAVRAALSAWLGYWRGNQRGDNAPKA